jgi:hypothetical protein
MKKYLVTIGFTYSTKPKNEDENPSSKNKTITIGVFDTQDEAINEGNKSLEVFEKHFKLNPHYNKKERFSKNGGCFGSAKNLVTNLAYLQTPFSFFAKIQTLHYEETEQTIINVLNDKAC